MKGPAVFLVSLAAVAGIAVGVLLPVWQEKQEFLKAQPADASRSGAGAADAANALLDAFDPPPDRWAESLEPRLAELLETAGGRAGDGRVESGQATFKLPVGGLAVFFASLAERPIPPIDRLSVTGERDAESYDVRITFLLSPNAPGGR